ncbi:MAG: yqfD [Bacillota bacterium]|jgi:similar to stage IV sporulation protein|nr:yqfD [Bacillota bacterium]
MLIFRILNFLRGYVVIKILGSNYEKTLNLLSRRNISIWDVEKKDDYLSFKLAYDDYRKNTELFEENKMQLTKKTGIAFKLHKIKSRKGFLLGAFILIVCLYVYSTLIWSIELVGGNEKIKKEIKETLSSNEIKLPTNENYINEKHIETILYKNFKNFNFVEAYIEGSKLIIFIKEKNPFPEQIIDKSPTSIISTKNAVINKVIAKSGQPVIQEGDVVYEGQTLVMGIIKNKNLEEYTMVPSIGKVYGKTYYSFQFKEEKQRDIAMSTNKKENLYYLKINDKKLKIIGDTNRFKNYNCKVNAINIPIISNFTDISLEKNIYYEEKYEKVKIDENTAQNKMKINVFDDLKSMCSPDSRVITSSLNFTEDEKYYYLNAQIEVIEDIGKEIKIYPSALPKIEDIKEE